jgi:hypothetical protein
LGVSALGVSDAATPRYPQKYPHAGPAVNSNFRTFVDVDFSFKYLKNQRLIEIRSRLWRLVDVAGKW